MACPVNRNKFFLPAVRRFLFWAYLLLIIASLLFASYGINIFLFESGACCVPSACVSDTTSSGNAEVRREIISRLSRWFSAASYDPEICDLRKAAPAFGPKCETAVRIFQSKGHCVWRADRAPDGYSNGGSNPDGSCTRDLHNELGLAACIIALIVSSALCIHAMARDCCCSLIVYRPIPCSRRVCVQNCCLIDGKLGREAIGCCDEHSLEGFVLTFFFYLIFGMLLLANVGVVSAACARTNTAGPLETVGMTYCVNKTCGRSGGERSCSCGAVAPVTFSHSSSRNTAQNERNSSNCAGKVVEDAALSNEVSRLSWRSGDQALVIGLVACCSWLQFFLVVFEIMHLMHTRWRCWPWRFFNCWCCRCPGELEEGGVDGIEMMPSW